MRLDKRFGLLLVTLTVRQGAEKVELENIVVDTGSASTVLSVDAVASLGILPSPQDIIHHVFGIGGSEAVFARVVDEMQIGAVRVAGFEVEVAGMDYGLPINGLLGVDFLEATGAIVDIADSSIQFRRN